MAQSVSSGLDILLPFAAAVLFLLGGMGLLAATRTAHGGRALSLAVLVFSCGLFIALALCFYKFTIDDAYISLRYARNLANGYGLVFSTDGSLPVEGYTNFLWVLLETPLFLLKLPDPAVLHAVKGLGIAFGVAGLIAEYFLVRLLTGNDRLGLVAALLLAGVPQLSFWAIGGLETSMFIFWLLIGLYALVSEQRRAQSHILSMLFFTLMALTRPEGFFFATAILLWQIAAGLPAGDRPGASRLIRNILPGAALFILLFGAYFAWRYRFYGFPLPNTFYARSGTVGAGQILSRLVAMSPFLVYLLPFAALAWFGYFRFHPAGRGEKALLTLALVLLVGFAFAPKSEWMPGFRYELPFMPLLMLFVAVGLHEILFAGAEERFPRWAAAVPRLGVLFLLGAYLLHPAVALLQFRHYTDQLERAHVTLGKWLKQYAPGNASYASWDLGAVPYYSELPRIIEIHPEGLLSATITHKAYDVNDILSLTPSFLVLKPRPASGSTDGIFGFYANPAFQQDYQYLFSFAFRRDYMLDVYKHRSVTLSPPALEAGQRLAQQSLAEANAEAP